MLRSNLNGEAFYSKANRNPPNLRLRKLKIPGIQLHRPRLYMSALGSFSEQRLNPRVQLGVCRGTQMLLNFVLGCY